MSLPDHPILLFDGVCSLCDASVQFVIDRDPDAHFRFASLQSPQGRSLAATCGVDTSNVDTVVLIEGHRAWVQSDAVLRVAARLKGPWSWVGILRVVPRPVRDGLYRFVARNRTRWFGHLDQCRIPTPELRSRFLDL